MKRRNFLVAISSVSALSGCLTSDSTTQNPTTDTDTLEPTESRTENTVTETSTEQETPTEPTGTEVSGVISSDTTWSDSNYLITDTVQIQEGVTLTIEPEVSVVADDIGRGGLFLVHGDIDAVGTTDNPISFNGQGSRSPFFDADGSTPETFVELDNCVIENGGPLWERGPGGFSLSNSHIKGVEASYVWYPYKDSTGDYETTRTSIDIEYNTFIDSGGFAVGMGSSYGPDIDVNIRYNTFQGSRRARYGGLINNWVSYGNSQMTVSYNSFLDMTDEIVLSLPEGYDDASMEAMNNYWDTTDTDTIESMIFDSNDNINSAGEIPYEPILEEPHPDAPEL